MLVKYIPELDDLWIYYICECGKMRVHMCNGNITSDSAYDTFEQVRFFSSKSTIIHDDGEE